MPRIDVTQVLMSFDNKPLRQPRLDDQGRAWLDKDGRPEFVPVTLRDVAIQQLLAREVEMLQRGQHMDPKDMLTRWDLATRLNREDKPELSASEITLVLAQVARMNDPQVYGRVKDMIDPAPAS